MFIYALILILIIILPATFLSELEDLFSSDELAEMGIVHHKQSTA